MPNQALRCFPATLGVLMLALAVLPAGGAAVPGDDLEALAVAAGRTMPRRPRRHGSDCEPMGRRASRPC